MKRLSATDQDSNPITNVPDPTAAQDAATKAYVDNAVVGLLDYRGTHDASGDTYPSTGGSGLLGAILKGDFWVVSVSGTLGSTDVTPGDLVIALADTPATDADWDLVEHDLGYAPEDSANKVTSVSGSSTDTEYPSAKLLYDQLALKRPFAPRVGTTTSSGTPTINTDNVDVFTITAQAAAITSMTTNLSGTPTAGQKLLVRIKDNGTARAITWGASFGNSGSALLPTTTVISKTHWVGLVWDEVAALWVCVAADGVGY